MISSGIAELSSAGRRQSGRKYDLHFTARLDWKRETVLLLVAFEEHSIKHPGVDSGGLVTDPYTPCWNTTCWLSWGGAGVTERESVAREFEQPDMLAGPGLRHGGLSDGYPGLQSNR